jgi:ribosomal protein S18 acetylase RimI-like enzyme
MATRDAQVRQATAEDAGTVAPLFALYREFYGKPYDEPAAAAFLHARLSQGQSVVLVAEVDGRPVGFTQLYPGFSSVSAAPAWTLNDLYVLSDARGSGAAAALMEQAEVLARQAGAVSLVLETARDNLVAQRLYERQGYVVDDGLHYEKRMERAAVSRAWPRRSGPPCRPSR